jgi:hypothetical protein
MTVTCKSMLFLVPLIFGILQIDAMSVEGTEFQYSATRPDIPYTLYVGVSYLLLVPREVDIVHKNFPPMPDPPQRYRLRLSDHWINEYRRRYNSEPEFHHRNVEFGLEDDEVIVVALLDGSNLIPYWTFNALFKGDNGHSMDISSDAKVTFGAMQWDLNQLAMGSEA